MGLLEVEEIDANNFRATQQHYPEEFNLFMELDQLYERTIKLVSGDSPAHRIQAPLFLLSHRLYINAVLNLCRRKGLEAAAIFRGALEAAGQAHRMKRAPYCVDVWMNKVDNPERFREEFTSKKMFPKGQPLVSELMVFYSGACEAGSHISISSLAMRYSLVEHETGGGEARVEYVDKNERPFEILLLWLIRAATLVLDVFVDIFSDQVEQVLAWRAKRSNVEARFHALREKRRVQFREADGLVGS